jgi:hypothetical protein
MPFLWGILVLIVLIGVYVGFTLLNERTQPPEGCELPEDFSGCGGCHSATCSARQRPAKENRDDRK